MVEQRTRSLLADGKDDLLLTINRSGVRLASQVGRECRLDVGAAVLMSCADVGGLDSPCATRYLTLIMPRRRLNAMAVNPEDALARPIPADTEALRLLVDYVETTLHKHQLTSPQLRQLFTTHVHDLVALAVGATRETSEAAHDRGLRAARLGAIKSHIADRLDNEGLSVTDVAKRRGLTARHVQTAVRIRRHHVHGICPRATACPRLPHARGAGPSSIGRSAPSHSKSDSAIYPISIACSAGTSA